MLRGRWRRGTEFELSVIFYTGTVAVNLLEGAECKRRERPQKFCWVQDFPFLWKLKIVSTALAVLLGSVYSVVYMYISNPANQVDCSKLSNMLEPISQWLSV